MGVCSVGGSDGERTHFYSEDMKGRVYWEDQGMNNNIQIDLTEGNYEMGLNLCGQG
jgi:hypothetical protein